MEENKRSFIHDTIDLDEIRELLNMGAAEKDSADDLEIPGFPSEIFTEVPDDQEAPASVFQVPKKDPVVAPMAEEEPADEEEILPEEAETPVTVEEEVSVPEEVLPPEPEMIPGEESMPAEEPDAEEVPQRRKRARKQKPAKAAPAAEQPQEETKKKTSVFYESYCLLQDVIYLLAAVTLIFVFVVRLVGVQGDSMLPTLHNKDFLILESNFLYNGDDLDYGDVVVLSVPYYKDQGEGPIVKRIIATEGQTVDIDFDNGLVFVDGIMLQEDYTHTPTNYNWDDEHALEYPVVVPEGCVFVLGDNRNDSMDSRFAPIGMVDEQYILGKVIFLVLPGQTKDAGSVVDPREWGRIGLVS